MFYQWFIGSSDGATRDGTIIPFTVIRKMYVENWRKNTVSHLGHNFNEPIAWSKTKGIFILPGHAYVIGAMAYPENSSEKKQLEQDNDNEIKDHYSENNDGCYGVLRGLLKECLSSSAIPAPVNFIGFFDKGILFRALPKLKEKMVDGLIELSELEFVRPGIYRVGDYLICAHRYFRRACSIYNSLNTAFLERYEQLYIKNKDLSVKIKIDEDIIGLVGTDSDYIEHQYWYGPRFDDDLSSIPEGVTRHENKNELDRKLSHIGFTEFGWYIQDKRKTFECEEVVEKENITENDSHYYGCRFVHSMLSEDTGKPYHLDGAIRAYSEEQIINRWDSSIKNSERDTVYTKLWRVDNEFEVHKWKELITHYYRDNYLISEYFDGVDATFDEVCNESVPLDHKEMKKGDGVALFYRYDEPFKENEYDVICFSHDFIYIEGCRKRVIEAESLTVIKLLKRYGYKIRIPYTARIATEDMTFNFPCFRVKSFSVANDIQKAIMELCNEWVKQGDNRLISYALQVNQGDKSVQYMFAGHVDDFKLLFSKGILRELSPDYEKQWIDKYYSISSEIFNENRRTDPLKMIDDSGWIEHSRRTTDNPNQNLHGKRIVPRRLIRNTVCSHCGKYYESCECVKLIDEGVVEKIEESNIVEYCITDNSSIQ